jgi:transposase
MDNYIGIDVAKASLQVYIPKEDLDIEVSNTSSGLKSLCTNLKKIYQKDFDNVVFIYESTGSYSTMLERFCQTKSIKCFKVGSCQSSSFSKTIKNRNKTDKVDARMLSAMHILANEKDIKVPQRDEEAHKIRSFIKYYQFLNKDKVKLKNYLEAASYNFEDTYVLRRVKNRIKQISAEQEKIINKAMDVININLDYKKSYENITSIKGVGQKSGIILLYLFLRYPGASRQQITALSGLDPIQKESGTSIKHKTRISKQGLSLVRNILYMPVLGIVRYNNEMRNFYERLVDRGKPKRLAQIAVMRKVILLANSLYKNDQTYEPDRYLSFIQEKAKAA